MADSRSFKERDLYTDIITVCQKYVKDFGNKRAGVISFVENIANQINNDAQLDAEKRQQALRLTLSLCIHYVNSTNSDHLYYMLQRLADSYLSGNPNEKNNYDLGKNILLKHQALAKEFAIKADKLDQEYTKDASVFFKASREMDHQANDKVGLLIDTFATWTKKIIASLTDAEPTLAQLASPATEAEKFAQAKSTATGIIDRLTAKSKLTAALQTSAAKAAETNTDKVTTTVSELNKSGPRKTNDALALRKSNRATKKADESFSGSNNSIENKSEMTPATNNVELNASVQAPDTTTKSKIKIVKVLQTSQGFVANANLAQTLTDSQAAALDLPQAGQADQAAKSAAPGKVVYQMLPQETADSYIFTADNVQALRASQVETLNKQTQFIPGTTLFGIKPTFAETAEEKLQHRSPSLSSSSDSDR